MAIPMQKEMNGILSVDRFSINSKLIAVGVGVAILTIASKIEVPMYPVPMTMQTYAVLLLACLFGARLGCVTVASWMGLTALGLPLMAGAEAGLIKFTGPTAGYVYGFFLATAFVGFLSDRGWNGTRPLLAFISMFIGTKIIIGLGYLWLGSLIGWNKAWELGVAPFWAGDLLKVILAVISIAGIQHFMKKR